MSCKLLDDSDIFEMSFLCFDSKERSSISYRIAWVDWRCVNPQWNIIFFWLDFFVDKKFYLL